MNPFKYSKNIWYLVAFLWLNMAFGCNKTANDTQSEGVTTDESGGLFSSADERSAAPVVVDSLYILNYISKIPQFKEHADLMFLFYGERDYRSAWFKDGKLVPQTENFMEAVNHSAKEGLDPNRYKVVDISSKIKQYNDMSRRDTARTQLQKEIDVALTASYFNFASDFYKGRLNPGESNLINWNVKKNKVKLHKALQTILKERESTYPYYEFEALHDGYVKLRESLKKYRELQQKGGWSTVDLGKRKFIKPGDTARAVLSIRKRLNPEKKISMNDTSLYRFDKALEQQVKHFQMLHGLDTDGVVGGNTLKAMNVSVDDRIDQLIINMERWRWIPKRLVPKSLDQKFIWVNIPEYKLYIYEDPDNDPEAERKYKKVKEMRVIVGKTMNSTPIFSEKLEFVVMAPYWNVPNSIVENEIKPAMLRNPDWLAKEDMEIVTKEKNPKRIPISSIDWASVTEKNFPYMVRQRPGRKNALGSIKFLFPNEFSVYLHDTPTESLFNQTQRGFSHGCVRVERPMDLATYLLQDMPEWTEDRIQATINGGDETWVTLPKKVQVYLVYFTSWVDENGEVHFREDIYGHDKKLSNEYFG
ncbi:L,D-transpeptidase family protein [Botryobacter ruber]|uniref:L,D-transpeptidase family protein n=1 Tax=Botryobacter ruber TaxID=2171629 RepID=UPI001F0BDFF3|nr:L,D-transpeptidase family protein [Botryobacter ruber]